MGILSERLRQLKISVTSPDESVSGVLNRDTGFGIYIHADAARHHSDESLAGQIGAVLGGLLRGHARGVEVIRAEDRGDRAPACGTPAVRRRESMRAAVDEHMTITATGPEKYATVTWNGMLDIAFSLRRGALAYLSHGDLVRETNAVMAAAVRARESKIVKAYRLIYIHDDEKGNRRE